MTDCGHVDPPLRYSCSFESYHEVKQDNAESSLLDALREMRKHSKENDDSFIDEDCYLRLYRSFMNHKTYTIDWSLIKQPDEDKILYYESLPSRDVLTVKDALSKLVVIKLNGGLGTSMGCFCPKSLITVRDGLTFLDLTVKQIENLNIVNNCQVPLILMNSFSTQKETDSYLAKLSNKNVKIITFEQNRFPRLLEESCLPYATSMTVLHPRDPAWYPPGHGDIYRCFYQSGLLKKFIEEGKMWAFISNIDNLGATVDENILSHLEHQRQNHSSIESDFVMEVTAKTLSDIKGGALVSYKDRLNLLELSQVPKKHIEEFLSFKNFNMFNTNNLWINLEAWLKAIENNSLQMQLIVNKKVLSDNTKVIQLEEAVGAAIHSFDRPLGLSVPRSRFLPVKVTADLFLLMSDLYCSLSGALIPSPNRKFPSLPIVKLGQNLDTIMDFQLRIPIVPSIIELYHLTISGNVTFGKDVTLKGTVIIIAKENEQIDIPSGSIIENKVITGNLRLMAH